MGKFSFMKYWIVPNNGQKFNMESAVRANNGFVDWRIKNVEIGDIVFMYKNDARWMHKVHDGSRKNQLVRT